jgi:hypothetical protein
VQQPVRVHGVARPRLVEPEVEALAGGLLDHPLLHGLGLGQRHAVLVGEPLGGVPLDRARRGRVELEAAVAHLDLVAVLEVRRARSRTAACRWRTRGTPRPTRSRPARFAPVVRMSLSQQPIRPVGSSRAHPRGGSSGGPPGRPGGPVGRGRRRPGLQRLEHHPDRRLQLRVTVGGPVLRGDVDLDVGIDAVVLDAPAGALEPQRVPRLGHRSCRRPASSARRCRSRHPRCGCRRPGRCRRA